MKNTAAIGGHPQPYRYRERKPCHDSIGGAERGGRGRGNALMSNKAGRRNVCVQKAENNKSSQAVLRGRIAQQFKKGGLIITIPCIVLTNYSTH